MFYNLHRSTKSGREEMEKARLTGAGQSLINPKERLLNFQKRQKLKNLLITKFMQKYGINQPDQVLETEITKFLQSEKLTDVDLQRLDAKLKKIYQSRKSKQLLKSTLTHTLLDRNTNLNKSQPDLFPRIQEQKNPNLTSTLNQSLNNQNIEYKKIDNNEIKSKKLRPSASMEMPIRNTKTKYKNPEEELAELEAEFAEEEKEMLKKKNYTRIDFSGMGDEWMAMAQYNKKLYEKQIKEEKEKDAEIKRRTKEDLDNQIKEKLKREYEEVLKEREGEKIYQEHLKHIDELEKEKQEALKRQIIREKK